MCCPGSWSNTITPTSWSLLGCARRNSPSTLSWSSFKVNVILLDTVFMSFSLSTGCLQRFIEPFSPPTLFLHHRSHSPYVCVSLHFSRWWFSLLFAHWGSQSDTEDVGQNDWKCRIWHGVPGEQKMHSQVGQMIPPIWSNLLISHVQICDFSNKDSAMLTIHFLHSYSQLNLSSLLACQNT